MNKIIPSKLLTKSKSKVLISPLGLLVLAACSGGTSKDQALRLGRWVLLTSNKEEETVSFVTDKIAEHLRPGYVFEVSDSIRNGYKGGGRVKKVVNNKNVASDNYILLDDTVDTNDYNFQSISFNIPGEDLEEQSKQFKTFIHRPL